MNHKNSNRIMLKIMQLRNYFARSIQNKLISTLIIVIMLPLIILLIISINIARGTVESSEITSNISRIDLSGEYISSQLHEYDETIFRSLVDEMLVPSLTEEYSIESFYNIRSVIRDKIYSLYNSRVHIDSVSFISLENRLEYQVLNNEFFVNSYLEPVENSKQKDMIFKTEKDHFILERNIFRFEDKKLVGKVRVSVQYALFDPIIRDLQSNEGENILLISTSGEVLYNPHNIAVESLSKKVSQKLKNGEILAATSYQKDGDRYVFQKKLNDDIILMKLVPDEIMNIGAKYIQRTGTVIITISIIIAILTSIFVAKRITKPIIQLSNEMEKIEDDNFHLQFKLESSDEIGVLYRKFQEMLVRIRLLIERDYKREVEKKEAQFLALQAQINPHFLYNTLQVIGGIAIKNNINEIDDISQKLSGMFRYITKNQQSVVSIEEEFEHLKNYLYIQQVRFNEQVNIQLFADEEAKEGLIPLLTIQPLIENCFIHGFTSKVDDWQISVDIQKVFDEVEIIIEDNGKGIPSEQLKIINENLLAGSFIQRGRIGITNVNSRMKLYFGKEYGIEVTSEEGKFTRLTLRIPFKMKGV